jgi:hypothetical protein
VTGVPWTDCEPSFFAMRGEVGRLFRRGRRRSGAVLLVALLTAAVAVLVTLRSPRKHHARAAVRVTELVDLHLPRSAWSERELRGYVSKVAFTDEVVLAVWRKHVWDGHTPVAPARAVQRMRDELEVRVLQSRTVAAEQVKSGPRSAHVTVGFKARSRSQALAVVDALTEPIIRVSAGRRRDEAAQETRRATLAVEQARDSVEAATMTAMAAAGSLARARTEVSPLRVTGMDSALAEARRRLAHLEAERQAAERRQRAESQRPGIDFERAQTTVVSPLPLAPLLALVAAVAWLLALPLATLVVGAFTRTVDSVEDLRRWGFPALGRLSARRLRPPVMGGTAGATATN